MGSNETFTMFGINYNTPMDYEIGVSDYELGNWGNEEVYGIYRVWNYLSSKSSRTRQVGNLE